VQAPVERVFIADYVVDFRDVAPIKESDEDGANDAPEDVRHRRWKKIRPGKEDQARECADDDK
jgi:hypothetical protein